MSEVRIGILVVCFLLLSLMAYSQSQDPDSKHLIERKNSIDLSIGGNGLFASVNYSRIILVKSNYFMNTSVGIGVVPFVGGMTLPHQVTFNLGSNNSFIEFGIGGSYWNGKSNASGFTETITSYQLSPLIGWRKNFSNNLVFRVYGNPLFHISGVYYIEDYIVIPYLGISLGYNF